MVVLLALLRFLPQLLVLDLVLLGLLLLSPELVPFELEELDDGDPHDAAHSLVNERTDPALFLELDLGEFWAHRILNQRGGIEAFESGQYLDCEDAGSCGSEILLVRRGHLHARHVEQAIGDHVQSNVLRHLVVGQEVVRLLKVVASLRVVVLLEVQLSPDDPVQIFGDLIFDSPVEGDLRESVNLVCKHSELNVVRMVRLLAAPCFVSIIFTLFGSQLEFLFVTVVSNLLEQLGEAEDFTVAANVDDEAVVLHLE